MMPPELRLSAQDEAWPSVGSLASHSVLWPPHLYTPGCKVAAACLFTSEGPGLCSRNVTRYGLQEARPILGKNININVSVF